MRPATTLAFLIAILTSPLANTQPAVRLSDDSPWPSSSPSITEDGGVLRVAWIESWPSIFLGEWIRPGTVRLLDSTDPVRIVGSGVPQEWITYRGDLASYGTRTVGGRTYAVSRHGRTVRYRRPGSNDEETGADWAIGIHTVEAERWRMIWRRQHFADGDASSPDYWLISLEHEPDADQAVGALLFRGAASGRDSLTIFGIDDGGGIAWDTTYVELPGTGELDGPDVVIPIGAREFLAIGGTTATRYRGAERVTSFDFPRRHAKSEYERLRDGRLLRASRNLQAPATTLEIFDLDGGLIESAAFDIDLGERPHIIERPDGSIVLAGARSGVHSLHVDRSLRLIFRATVEDRAGGSDHPSAVVVGDSLFIVREGRYGGVTDVYGHAMLLDAPSAVPAEPAVGSGLSITPSVATDRFTVTIIPAHAPRRIEIIDARGAVAQHVHVAAGADRIAVDASAMSAGVYFVRLQGTAAGARLTVVR